MLSELERSAGIACQSTALHDLRLHDVRLITLLGFSSSQRIRRRSERWLYAILKSSRRNEDNASPLTKCKGRPVRRNDVMWNVQKGYASVKANIEPTA